MSECYSGDENLELMQEAHNFYSYLLNIVWCLKVVGRQLRWISDQASEPSQASYASMVFR
jgi:hypothetical protein